MQLHETNKQLRALAAEELDKPETRRQIENQASAERQNGRRLIGPVERRARSWSAQAMRNPEFGVGHLEKWAEMLQILKDISGNRMPSVADLLKEAGPGRRARWPRRPAAEQPRRADGRPGPGLRHRPSRPRRSRASRRTSR